MRHDNNRFVLILLLLVAITIPFCNAGFWGSGGGPTDGEEQQQQHVNNNVEGEETLKKQVTAPTSKLDYKLTFKRPYFYNGTIPFWKMSSDIIKADDFIRLAPSIPGARGWVWSERPNEYEEWQAEVTFRVTGSHMHGGRGLAFWYTKEAMGDGPIFGAADKWDGLGIWLDSANPRTHTPTTMALLNDGTLAFASRTDPEGYIIGSCQINYRNTGTVPAHLRVTYTAKTLTVMLDPMGDGKDYRTCIQKTGINLPSGYYFGFSAASHNPADDHDILSFETWQLNPPVKVQHTKRPMEEEKIQQGEEFKELNEEQKRQIEEAEYQVRRMREAAEGEEVRSETMATLASVFDTQRRVLEDIQIMQMQIEAIGAPSPENLLLGNYEAKKPVTTDGSADNKESLNAINRVTEDVQRETRNMASQMASQMERQSRDQDRRMKEVESTLERIEKTLNNINSRMNIQQKRMNEIGKDSAETRGTMSTLFKYIFYAFGVQAVVGFAVYLYWKLRVERNEKKFL